MFLKPLLLIFLGGGLGSCLRFLISYYFKENEYHFVYGTLLVNVLGGLFLGFILASFQKNLMNQEALWVLGIGFCGGFTTFSTFSAENYQLLKDGLFLQFGIYALVSIIAGIGAIALGFYLQQVIQGN